MARPTRQQKTNVAPSMVEEPLEHKILAYVKSSPGATYQELATNFQASVGHVRTLVKQLRHNRLIKIRKANGRIEVRASHPAVWTLADDDPNTIHAADLFCGFGGFSCALGQVLEAMGRDMSKHVDLVGINHDEAAIIAWKQNHKDGRECREDITKAQPRKLFPGGRLNILLASPSCTHHSVARGGKPVSDQLRSHPWMVVRWARDLDIKTIICENVGELQNWGPTHVVDCTKCMALTGNVNPKCKHCEGEGRIEVPIPGKEGTIFRQWLRELKLLGYSLDWKILNAADYGDATSRKRFFMIAHKGEAAITWPKQTHSKLNPKTGKPSVPGTKPWRAAREIIDFTLPSMSIFDREANGKRPLAPKTLKRMYDGLEKRNGAWIRPFLVMLRGTGTTNDIDQPMPTATASGTHIGLCEPVILGQQSGAVARGVSTDPLNTVATGGAIGLAEPSVEPVVLRSGGPHTDPVGVSDSPLPAHLTREHQALAEPVLMHLTHGGRDHSVDDPLKTVTTAQRGEIGVAEPFIMASGGPTSQMQPRDIERPLSTVIGNTRLGIVEPVVIPPDGPGGNGEFNYAKGVNEPLNTIRAGRGGGHLAEGVLIQYNGTSDAQPVDQPLPTQPTHERFGFVEPCLVDMLGSKDNWAARSKGVDVPLPTNHAGGVRTGVAQATLEPVILTTDRPDNNRSLARGTDEPLPTVVANNVRIGIAEPEAILVPNFGEREGQKPRSHSLSDPLPAPTGHGAGMLATPVLEQGQPSMTWVNGRPCINGWILDVKFRMLQPKELAASMSFPKDFVYSPKKTEAVKQIGNAVAVGVARALIGEALKPQGVNLHSFLASEAAEAAA